MKLNTLYQTCVYFTIVILIFTLSINFVSALDVFGSVEAGADVDLDDGNTTFENIAENPVNTIWTSLTSNTGIAGLIGLGVTVGLGVLTRSPVVIGVGLFSTVFWTSYINMYGVLNVGGYVPVEMIGIGHIIMMFLWMGAVIGMFSGSG